MHNARVRAGVQGASPTRAEDWQVTYLDTITILLTLFLLIVAVGQLDEDSREAHDQALRDVASDLPAVSGITGEGADYSGTDPTAVAPGSPTDSAFNRLQAFIDETQLSDRVALRRDGDELILDIRDSVLFPSASAAVSGEGVEVLAALSRALSLVPGEVSVEGHSDDLPITTERFPSNWELSAGRASSIVRIFEERGLQSDRLHAVAYGATRPVAPNSTEAGRARNRRVEIKIKAPQP